MFSEVTASRPGELVQIDSTPFDVMVLLDKGVPGRVELTGMVDLATRSVSAAVLRPTTKSVDASLLLAKAMTPEAMRPGWAEALAMARSVLPHRRMLALDERLEHAAARPVIVPEMIVCDRGSVYISANFRTSCHVLGIDFQPAHQDTPTDKPHIERTLESVSTLFAQYVSGYLGRSTEYRGRKVEEEPLWSLMELQALLEEWIVADWQNRPHDTLRDPSAPGRAFTPNERYAALVESSGYVPVALSADDYIELLPARWQAINAYGVKIDHRTYDDEALNSFPQAGVGVMARKNLWEVHHDPYDVTRIWVRNHRNPDGGWITLFWKHLRRVPTPFGELAWKHAKREVIESGGKLSEVGIADAVRDLLDRASKGPSDSQEPARKNSKQSKRAAAATKATAAPAWPRPAEPPTAVDESPDDVEDEEEIADVVPLPIFDARKEAEKWW
jgi:putative transposase